MRNLKRALSLLLSSTMVLGMLVMGSSAVGYKDVEDSNTHQEAIEVLQAVGIMTGDQNGNFNPDGSITRNEMAVIMAHLLNLDYDYYRGTNPFTDVPEWAAPYVAACAAEGVVAGIGNGQFGGDQKVTAAQASLMIMKALGYFQNAEDFGSDWQVATIRQASYIDLFDNINANAESALTRAQVAQLVLNGLLSDMVDFTGDKGIQIGDVTVGYRAEYTSKTSSAAKYNSLVGGKTDIAQQGQYYIQLGEELYNGKLTMRVDTDAFQRPATTWTYNSDTIGTYVNYDLMVGEYTTSVSGKELYDIVGKTAFDKYDFYSYVNGEKDNLYKQIAKDNKANIYNNNNETIDNGALTQVFVNNDSEEVIVTVINTYLAQANADYNEKKDTASFEVYGLTGENGTVSGEDFDIADIEADQFVLVTYADDAIQTISDVEILSNVEISKFSTNGTATSVTVDGTKYDASETLTYDKNVLDEYTQEGGSTTNLKDTTYNVYLDQYGYVIGVDIVEGVDNYVFITGMDSNSSNLSTKTWDANAIFMDGTSAVIKVKNNDAVAGKAKEVVNEWFTYTKSSDDVYTLATVNGTTAILSGDEDGDVAQKWTNAAEENKLIDSKHITLTGIGTDARVYGDDDTVYLLADLDKVSKTGQDYAVIKGVDEVVTGIDNAAFELYTRAEARSAAKATVGSSTNDTTSSGAYALYGDDGYVIAAVVVGESATVSKNAAYVISSGVSSESYDKSTQTWTWTRDVIINGEKVELTETNDTGVSALKSDDMALNTWVVVKYAADGTVKDVEPLTDDYVTSMSAAVTAIEDGEDLVYVQIADETNHEYTLKSNTLYDLTDDKLGFRIDSNVKIVLEQEVNNKTTTTYEEGSATLKAILEDLNENAKRYEFNAVIEEGKATSVIIIDKGADDDYEGPDGSDKTDIAKLSSQNNAQQLGAKIELTKSVAKDTTYNVELYMMNGGTWAKVDTVAVKVEAGTNYGFTAIEGLAAGQQYKLVCGDASTLFTV